MDDHPASPTGSDAMQDESPPSSPSPEDEPEVPLKKVRKKRKPQTEEEKLAKKAKKRKAKESASGVTMPVDDGRKKVRKQQVRRAPTVPTTEEPLSAAQAAANEQMRRALEDDAYSALGSIVDTDTDDDESDYRSRGGTVRLDRSALLGAMRKRLWVERMSGNTGNVVGTEDDDAKSNKKKRKKALVSVVPAQPTSRRKEEAERKRAAESSADGMGELHDEVMDRDEGSIFGQTAGASNATWVQCDKCKKWRRLRGVIDEKKLPSKWYCSMNKNDPERNRCTAPEEEYETHTPESAADALTRKHLRVWVRRLESNENYEARLPTMTRGKKRNAAPSAKEPSEWVRCCNPSCGKWRALLRCMEAKQHVIDRTNRGEWFCVMNTWDEKMASCAAPQENLPVIGCPQWVMQDEA